MVALHAGHGGLANGMLDFRHARRSSHAAGSGRGAGAVAVVVDVRSKLALDAHVKDTHVLDVVPFDLYWLEHAPIVSAPSATRSTCCGCLSGREVVAVELDVAASRLAVPMP